MNHRVFATLLSLLPLTPGCAAPNRLIPPGGQVAATRDGTLARLRVYYSPPPGSLLPRGTVAIYVALRNLGSQPLRVDYRDFFLDPPRGAPAAPLRPGDVLRPRRGESPQLVSLSAPLQPQRRPSNDEPAWVASGNDEAVDFLAPRARYRIYGPWVLQDDLGVGPQLGRDGWPFFGLPPLDQRLSRFDLLQATLADGDLSPGEDRAGFLFFPESAAAAGSALRWQAATTPGAERVATTRRSEVLTVSLQPAR